MGKTSFKDWLTEQEKKHSNEEDAGRKLQDWIKALDSLYVDMLGWLRQGDPEGVIRTSTHLVLVEEAEFGTYKVNSLCFTLGPRRVTVLPIARNVIGPAQDIGPLAPVRGEGRVDLISGIEKLHLYRVRDSQNQTRWVIVNQEQLTFRDLDKSTFEDALQRLFS